ncbi:hypothetical protein OFO03_07600 [Campylobacter sp. JMF_02 ED1]|uniref:hypothetical protein n=1 Tax=unclassified Campylobacter TaxID=2593542 RepID=UPI0022E9F764|nr:MULTISPECIES: hypothetical protein [unclassified Campylobacter]MDA3050090.1 hypothetical protein [Campylobacter sp. JMF_15 NE4]MDA3051764.1 hypothetical protein [Campylobacter sp. JMF_02 ED1]
MNLNFLDCFGKASRRFAFARNDTLVNVLVILARRLPRILLTQNSRNDKLKANQLLACITNSAQCLPKHSDNTKQILQISKSQNLTPFC